MLKAAFLPVVVFGLCGVALQALAVPATTTTMYPCLYLRSCRAILDSYRLPINLISYNQLATDIDHICDTLVPSVLQCLETNRNPSCDSQWAYPTLYQKFCQEKEKQALKAGAECWSKGYEKVKPQCWEKSEKDLVVQGICEGIESFMRCLRDQMKEIPQCSDNNIGFVLGYAYNRVGDLCPALSAITI